MTASQPLDNDDVALIVKLLDGLDDETIAAIPAATLARLRESAEAADPRALAAKVSRNGGGGRGYAQQRQAGRHLDVTDAELDQMTARQLAELVSPKDMF